jgi:Alpha-glutamyl/putrescinyl thymine pyrophosphorylase clade 3
MQRAARSRRPRGEDLRVHREGREQDDGYRSALLPGLRASADATRLIEEVAFASGRLLALGTDPPGLYAEARALAEHDLGQATWMCFLISYFSPLDPPLDGEDPFAGIRLALSVATGSDEGGFAGGGDGRAGPIPDLDGIPLGPRTSHDRARGIGTLLAYRQWVEQGGGQADAFSGDPGWSPQRRFERLFERLALPGFGRMGRYDLLVTLGCLGLYELRADSLHLSSTRGTSSSDLTTLAAKRLFAIGDPIHLERRAVALAQAIAVPVETLDLALANWASPQRATLGFAPDTCDPGALERAHDALGL